MNTRERGARLLSSPVLLVALCLTLLVLVAALRKVQATQDAPLIAGYDWGLHPATLLVVQPVTDSCNSCHLSLSGWAQQGLDHGLDVLILASRPSQELTLLKTRRKVSVIGTADRELVRRFAPRDQINGVLILNGRIVARQAGSVSSQLFDVITSEEVKT